MLAIVTVLVALLVSLLITRVATTMLVLTGMSRESARFQARSAFAGVGYTTSEAENVVGHPVRRRIVMTLMLLSNAGLVTILASLLLSFAGAEGSTEAWHRIALLVGGLGVLLFLAKSRRVERVMSKVIAAGLGRFTDLDVRDYAELLQLSGGYGVTELEVAEGHWLAGKTLEELDLRREGIAVLGIDRPGRGWEGVPRGSSRVDAGDTLLLYGHASLVAALTERPPGPEGDRAHEEAVRKHEAIETLART